MIMKKTALLFVLILSCAVLSAQESRMFRRGYRGNLEIGNYAVFGKDKVGGIAQMTTTQGFSFGDGAFVGLGLGLGSISMGVSSSPFSWMPNTISSTAGPALSPLSAPDCATAPMRNTSAMAFPWEAAWISAGTASASAMSIPCRKPRRTFSTGTPISMPSPISCFAALPSTSDGAVCQQG